MPSLAQYEQEESESQYFIDGLDRHLENNYQNLGNGLYYCHWDDLVFYVDYDNAKFDRDEEGGWFTDYKNYVEDIDKLNEIIIKLSTEISKLKSKK